MASRKKRSRRYLSDEAQDTRSLAPIDTDLLDMNDLPDEMKLSAKLIEIMEPWLEDIPIETLADYASLAWNAAVDGVDAYESIDYLRGGQLDEIHDPRAKDIIRQIKDRKLKLFPKDLRTVVRMQVVMDGNGDPTVLVASELKPDNFRKILSAMARNTR